VTAAPALRRLAVEATRGTTNNLFQVATLIRAATALDASVEVLFCDGALMKLTRERINIPEWSVAYSAVLPDLSERLKAAAFVDMESFLRDAKEHGDHVHYWACAETLAVQRLSLLELTPLLDGGETRTSFYTRAQDSDALLTF
jgi:peroxiredoxin family protein